METMLLVVKELLPMVLAAALAYFIGFAAALYAQECATKNITPNTETAYVAGAYWAIRNINLLK